MKFVMDNVALGQVWVKIILFPPVSIISLMVRTKIRH
jgi:hypothetical protein